jgi:hypothetical protein
MCNRLRLFDHGKLRSKYDGPFKVIMEPSHFKTAKVRGRRELEQARWKGA